ncbi:MAG TPA: multiheme c-type cytochrome, partial [Thermodesulfovibrionales bacterium]|nr:multiheme c-type cytochrome [Thermodesulfovibrionales bacterium]
MSLSFFVSSVISTILILLAPVAEVASAAAVETGAAAELPLSAASKTCIACHSNVTPGIVKDWETSRHSKVVVSSALEKPPLERRVSAGNVPGDLAGLAVGCYECHGMNNSIHKDSFEHMGRDIHVVVTPEDCKTCHPAEASQFSGSKKSFAHKILMENTVYKTLVDDSIGPRRLESGGLAANPPSASTLHETCLGCHGTKVEAKGMKVVTTRIGEIQVPALTNWPNQGVGRINPDGSLGACSACHPRHGFMIEVARKPYTCSQCHHEPDVPAWDVYDESKHGNIFFSKNSTWDFTAVPWHIGKDFRAPTCAVCHNSLLVSPAGDVVAERTHDFGSRLWVRLFGLIYSHPQPKSGDTTIIKNKDGLPMPTTFSGELASEYLIDKEEQEKRASKLKAVCNGCHNRDWIEGHFAKLNTTLKETDEMILTSTKIMLDAWGRKVEDSKDPFDESIEKMWTRQWLFYCNSIRYASAMTGA